VPADAGDTSIACPVDLDAGCPWREPVTIREQVDGLAVGQGDAANPDCSHRATLTMARDEQ
jgi:hypothetical protein